MPGAVEKAQRAELRKLGGAATSEGLFAQIVDLARAIDAADANPHLRAGLHRELRAAIADFRALAEKKPKARSTSDDLRNGRHLRLAGGSAS